MIGGTGLLGSAAAQIFVDRGNEIKTLALPPLPEGAPLPKEMEIVFQDANKLTDDEMIGHERRRCMRFLFRLARKRAPGYETYGKASLYQEPY